MNYTFTSSNTNINKLDAKTMKANSGTTYGQANIIDPPSGPNCITYFIKVIFKIIFRIKMECQDLEY